MSNKSKFIRDNNNNNTNRPETRFARNASNSTSGANGQWRARNQQQPTTNRSPYVPRISLNKVNELLVKQPDEIILALSDPRFDFKLYLNTDRMGEELLVKLLTVIEKAFQCNSFKAKLVSLISDILASKFFTAHVYAHLDRTIAGSYNVNFTTNVLKLCSTFLFLEPLAVDQLGPIRDRLEILVKIRIQDETLEQIWAEFVQLEAEAKNKKNRYRNQTFTNISNHDASEPPNDFTQMSIVPTLADIVSDQETFLRKNITNGAYKDVHHYLDVQFRLLREDFLQPLRHGVGELRKIVAEAKFKNNLIDKQGDLNKDVVKKIKRIESLNVYFDVRMSSCVASDFGIVYSMKLNTEKMKNINWEYSKRLIFGSLVCLSSDFFNKSCLVGVIAERDDKKLKKDGEIYIKFDQNNFVNNLPVLNESYIMLETSAFFEAYKHVLEALVSFQRHGEENFPFKENLVYCQNKDIPIPKYLTNTSVDFRFRLFYFLFYMHLILKMYWLNWISGPH
jgi:hypothetical protein